jgi:hypothetical protein
METFDLAVAGFSDCIEASWRKQQKRDQSAIKQKGDRRDEEKTHVNPSTTPIIRA